LYLNHQRSFKGVSAEELPRTVLLVGLRRAAGAHTCFCQLGCLMSFLQGLDGQCTFILAEHSLVPAVTSAMDGTT
jgi:hypothetical protein